MKKLRNILSMGLILLLAISLLVSCGSDNKRAESMADGGYDMMEESVSNSMAGTTTDSKTEADLESDLDQRKIIETVRLSVQTKVYDTLMQDLESKIAELGGYIESSQVNGREMDSSSRRYADLTVRIPSGKSSAFTGFVSENSVVVSKSIDTEDVTLSYVDMESRVKALEMEKVALEALLANAANVTEIMSIRENLTDVIYEIESYQTRLRTYDNLVDYTTVHLSVHEVERTTVVEKQNTWQKIGTNLKNNFLDVWEGLVDGFVFAISSLPYLIPIGLCLLVLWGILSIFLRRRRRKKTPTDQK